MSAECPAAQGVNLHAGRLAGRHFSQLRFLEVRHHPDFLRHDEQDLLAGLHIIAGLYRLARHAAGGRRKNLGVGQIELRRLLVLLR